MANYISFKVHNIVRASGAVINLEGHVTSGEMTLSRSLTMVHTSNRTKRARGQIQGPLEVALNFDLLFPQGSQGGADFIEILLSGEEFKVAGLLEGGTRRLLTGCKIEEFGESDDPETVSGSVSIKGTDLTAVN